MLSHASVEEPHHDPARAAGRVVESAVDLARAEVELVVAHARTALLRAVAAVLAGMLTAAALQAALLVWAFSPLLFASSPGSVELVALLPSVAVCALGTLLTILALRRLRGTAPGSSART